MKLGGWCVAAAMLSLACAPRAPRDENRPVGACRPANGALSADAPWDSVAGGWRLEMVADQGDSSGRRALGTLTLLAQDPAARRVSRPGMTAVTVPVIGATDIALEQVGALRLGDVRSLDPRQPGVSIWVSPGSGNTVTAVMRIGQEQIQSDLVRIDGGYTALFPRQLSSSAIRGRWASGVTGVAASGYFCAERSAK